MIGNAIREVFQSESIKEEIIKKYLSTLPSLLLLKQKIENWWRVSIKHVMRCISAKTTWIWMH
ncbi:hypothetical protein CEF21_21475 [Bacillus sp. FJAT-42376]|nr:hypothetical protein CEF21_21475 [Bacillus sp. FJAT-42376]